MIKPKDPIEVQEIIESLYTGLLVAVYIGVVGKLAAVPTEDQREEILRRLTMVLPNNEHKAMLVAELNRTLAEVILTVADS